MRRRGRFIACLLLVAACGDSPDDPAPAPAPAAPEAVPVAAVPARPELREDVGGWTPPIDVTARALLMRDPAQRETALVGLDPDARIDALRAGLRLRDVDAATACAARLTYLQMSNWECARAVDLLMPTLMHEESESQFEDFRAYVGSVELPEFLTTLPPTPWAYATDNVIGAMHRVMRGEHIPLYLELARSDDAELAELGLSQTELLQMWNDTHRRESAAVYLGLPRTTPTNWSGDGIDPLLVGLLRKWYLVADAPELERRVSQWVLRWLRDARPAQHDERFLIELAKAGGGDESPVGVAATVLLGLVVGDDSDAYIRARFADRGDASARLALARRGDEAALALAEGNAADDPAALAVLLEHDPARARRVVAAAVIGRDSVRAAHMFDTLDQLTAAATYDDFHGIAWQPSALHGIDALALSAGVDALRLGWIGAVVPGCRTRELAGLVATRIDDAFFVRPESEEDESVVSDWSVMSFLEVGAPLEFRNALRRVARDTDSADVAYAALDVLLTIGDPNPIVEMIDYAESALDEDSDSDALDIIARSGGPVVRTFLEERVAAAGSHSDQLRYPVRALAVFHGLPRLVAEGGAWQSDFAPGVVDAVLAGRPVDALALQLAAYPDEFVFNVGLVDDPRIAGYLQSFRERRSLECYWYATGELAAMGDPEARADFWGAMQDGRYRIMNDAWVSSRTMGFDLSATVPFWISELRSQCCRIVTSGEGDIMDELFELDIYETEFRTSYERVHAHWEAANGEFVWSHSAEHFVPAVR